MSKAPQTFAPAYASALARYLEFGEEAYLHRAYELGRSAIGEGIGIIDIVRIHHEAVDACSDRAGGGTRPRGAPAEFLAECLSSFEMTYRGFRDTIAKLEAEICERRRTEEHLRHREAQLAEAQRLAHVGSWEWDLASNTTHWSDETCRIYGVPPGEDLTFERYLQYQHPADRDRVRAMIETACRERRPFAAEGRILRPDGSVRIVHKRGEPVFDPKGNLVGMRVISQDITDRRKLQEELEASARQRAEDLRNFAFSIQRAHEEERQRIARELHDDLCQRLTAMRLHMNVFENDIPDEQKASRRRLTSIKRQIDTMITDVRRLSTNLRPVALDLFGLVTALRHLCEEVEKLHHVRVTFQTVGCAPERFGEQVEIALYRIAQEAITNAVKHAKPAGIRVTLASSGTAAELTVHDDGTGFAGADPHHPVNGGGLGLFTMRERAELMGAAFSIDSSPGGGTTIRVTIPGAEHGSCEKDQDSLCR